MIEDVVADLAVNSNQTKTTNITLRENLKIPITIFKECERTAYSWALDKFKQIDYYRWLNKATGMEIDLKTLIIMMWQGGMIDKETGKLEEKYDNKRL